MAVVMLANGLAQTMGQQVSALTMRMAPAANAMVQTWSLAGNQIIAAGDQLDQAVQGASQIGNTGNPGGLDPNDPWGKFNRLLGQGRSEIDAATAASTQGSGDRFVIGKYVSPEEFQRTGQAGYIQEAQARGGRYFDAGRTLWARLEQSEMAGEVNRQVIRRQMEGGIRRIELAGETIQQALSRRGSWTVEEIKWIREFAREFGYIEDATGWTIGP
jgi:hypothetical protein